MKPDSRTSFTDLLQLLVLDPEKRRPLEQVKKHPWIIKHCVKGERASMRDSKSTGSKSSGGGERDE